MRRRTVRMLTLGVLVALVPVGRADAQAGAGRDRVSERVAGARPMADRLAAVVQRRLGLTDEQARQLRTATARFAGSRETLLRGERGARRALRDEVQRGDAADQRRVGTLLDSLVLLQRRRAELLEGEQRELARFLTPVQRAEYLGLQERAFRAAQQIRQRRELRGEGAPPGADRMMGRPRVPPA